jgi:hypothetical protein
MKKFSFRLLGFCTPVLLYCVLSMTILPQVIPVINGPNSQIQLESLFRNVLTREYDLLVMGNSKPYRGINPDQFSIPTFNFSYDDDSYNQMYYKLKFLESQGKRYKYLVLGVEYYQFSFKSNLVNYVYADYLDDAYAQDFNDNIWMLKFQHYFEYAHPRKLLFLKPIADKPYLRDNGQYIKPGLARETDSSRVSIDRLPFQVDYFEKILAHCKANEIPVFLLMMPTRENELKSYTLAEREEFDAFIDAHVDGKRTYFLNFCQDTSFRTADYTDINHLNEAAADRFSRMLNDSLMGILRAPSAAALVEASLGR